MRRLVSSLLVLLLVAGPVQATDHPRQISVSGEGRVEAAPDMAMITLGVSERAETAAEAMRATSAAVALILTRLEAAGLAARDVQTRAITLYPIHNNKRSNDTPPEIIGFEASNTLNVRVRDLALLGPVLDGVLEDGANTFGGLRFSVQDPAPLMQEARRRAVADGMARAKLLAEGAGVVLGPVQTITDVGRTRGPQMMEMTAARADSVPIAAGELSLSATVSMVFVIEDS